jgi:hypothetical protein
MHINRVVNMAASAGYAWLMILIVLLFANFSLAAERHMTVNNYLKDAGVVIIDSTSSAFDPEIQKLLTPEAQKKALPFLSSSLVVINNTGQYIWGFTIVYTYPDWTAPAGTAWKHRISPSAGGAAQRNLMLAPGDSFLITPVSDFLASADSSGKRFLQPFLDEGMDRMIAHYLSQQSVKNERVEILADSVIFEDGMLLGPDTEGMMSKVNERIRAEKDFISSVENLRGEVLHRKLQLHSQAGMVDEHSGQMSNHASAVLNVFDRQGEAAAVQIIETIKSRKWFSNPEGTVRRKQ